MGEFATGEPVIGTYSHEQALNILAGSDTAALKAFAEEVLIDLGDVTVVTNRTGLAMLPFRDTVKGTSFHLGEVLVAEAHIRLLASGVEGYGAVTGRDLEQAMAMAVIDAAIAVGHHSGPILAFIEKQDVAQREVDRERLRKVEATRVQMETF
jgi:alpha-D-ribose 1-methylphosphonate 5-triphosphate synthase subunit PhnG